MNIKVKKRVRLLIFAGSLFLIIASTLLFRPRLAKPMYELTLFWSYRAAADRPDLVEEIILNYILYIPFGFSLKLVWPKMKWWKAVIICLLLSSGIEFMQLVFRLGLFEFDDIWGNTIGGLIGFGICRVLFPYHHYTELSRKR